MKLAPIDCKTERELLSLETDNYSSGKWWILTDSFEVSLTEQKNGESPTRSIEIPKAKFDALIQWYLRKQECRAKAGDI